LLHLASDEKYPATSFRTSSEKLDRYATPREPNHRCRQILQTTRLFQGGRSTEMPRIDQQEERDLPSQQRPATHIFAQPQKIIRVFLGCLPHLPSSPDLAPADYHLFRSLQNSLNSKIRMPSNFTFSDFSRKKT